MQAFHFSQSLGFQRLVADFHRWRSDELMIRERIAPPRRANESLRCKDSNRHLRNSGRAAALPNKEIASARGVRDPCAEHVAGRFVGLCAR